MNGALISLLILVGQLCPPGSPSCPAPSLPRPGYAFSSTSSNPRPWATAVRITARSGGEGVSYGSGTVIDGRPDSGLVMTCAHVLRGEPAPVLVVEIFAGATTRPVRGPVNSVGPPIARYEAFAVDRDDATDVGLVRFRPGRELPASPLVPSGWSAEVGQSLCSMGCDEGADPTARSERYARPVSHRSSYGPYRGLGCERRPTPGRSGGGLFDVEGRLAGVCDMASDSPPFGYYAEPESLRAILVRNGLVELASGSSRRQAPPAVPPPSADLPPFEAPKLPSIPASTAYLPALAGAIAGVGVPLLGLVAWIASRIKRNAPWPLTESPGLPPSPVGEPGQLPAPAVLIPLLVASLKASKEAERARLEREERERSEAESTAEILRQVEALIERAHNPPKP